MLCLHSNHFSGGWTPGFTAIIALSFQAAGEVQVFKWDIYNFILYII